MESIFKFSLIFILLILIYYWSLYYYNNNTKIKKIYIPSSKSNIEKFSVGGIEDNGNDDEDSYCEPNPCENGGICTLDDDYDYICECKSASGVDSSGKGFSGRSFSGRNCEFEDDEAEGVRVELLKNIDEIVPITEFNRVYLFDTDDIQWNDYL